MFGPLKIVRGTFGSMSKRAGVFSNKSFNLSSDFLGQKRLFVYSSLNNFKKCSKTINKMIKDVTPFKFSNGLRNERKSFFSNQASEIIKEEDENENSDLGRKEEEVLLQKNVMDHLRIEPRIPAQEMLNFGKEHAEGLEDDSMLNNRPSIEPVEVPTLDEEVLPTKMEVERAFETILEEICVEEPKVMKLPSKDSMGRASAQGWRKSSFASVIIKPGFGDFKINGRPHYEYFRHPHHRHELIIPFNLTETFMKFDVSATTRGGGFTGQSQAIRLAISRALAKFDPKLEEILKKAGLLWRDPRVVEPKKPGLKKARKAPTWVKR